jgi:hypothetical protein
MMVTPTIMMDKARYFYWLRLASRSVDLDPGSGRVQPPSYLSVHALLLLLHVGERERSMGTSARFPMSFIFAWCRDAMTGFLLPYL